MVSFHSFNRFTIDVFYDFLKKINVFFEQSHTNITTPAQKSPDFSGVVIMINNKFVIFAAPFGATK